MLCMYAADLLHTTWHEHILCEHASESSLQGLSLLASGGSKLANSLRQDLKVMDIRSFFKKKKVFKTKKDKGRRG